MSEWNQRWFVCVYGNKPEFHSLAQANSAVITIPGSASTAWFETEQAAIDFCHLCKNTTGSTIKTPAFYPDGNSIYTAYMNDVHMGGI